MTKTGLTLGDLEIATLETLWADGETDARALHGRLGKSRGITLSTMQSTLERLYRKGLVEREKVSHAYVYRPAEGRDAVMARMVDAALDRFQGGRRRGLLAAFAGFAAQADDSALDEIEALISERKRQQHGGGT